MTPFDPTAPLSIAVIGAGSIGSAFADRLARAGHAVTVVARPGSARLAQLRRDGGVIDKAGDCARMQVAERLDEAAAYDLVLVTTLDHQVGAVLPDLALSQARWIQFMFNSFEPERLVQAVGAHRASLGMPFVMARLDGEGRLDCTIQPGQKSLHGDARWADLFRAAGVPSSHEPRMALWLRCHAPMCIAMESICFAAQRRGAGASWGEAMTVARGLKGGFAVVRGLGGGLYPASKAMLAAAPTPVAAAMLWGASRITAFRELLATGAAEARALADGLADAAMRAAPPLPAAAKALLAMKPVGDASGR
jgi:2-dehydropantoate 2-reductase